MPGRAFLPGPGSAIRYPLGRRRHDPWLGLSVAIRSERPFDPGKPQISPPRRGGRRENPNKTRRAPWPDRQGRLCLCGA